MDRRVLLTAIVITAIVLAGLIYWYIKSIDIPPCLRCELYKAENGCIYWIEFPEGHVPPAQASIEVLVKGVPTWLEAFQVLDSGEPGTPPGVGSCPEATGSVRIQVRTRTELR